MTTYRTASGEIAILGAMQPAYQAILTEDALAFVAEIVARFGPERDRLLALRRERQKAFDAGALPDFLPETAAIRAADWRVAPIPADLQDRRVEITGPVDRKMVINALNAPVKCFMACFEDALSPTWDNLVQGQINLRDAVAGSISFANPDGKEYRLADETAVLIARPRGWHLPEKHVTLNGQPIPGALLDFALYFFHNARALIARGSGPYYYLPKMESHLEARLWAQVMDHSEDRFELPRGTIKATVLIETLPAVFDRAWLSLSVDRPCYEAEFGARTRILESLERGVPVCSTDLCDLTHELAIDGLIHTVPTGDADAVASVLVDLAAGRTTLLPQDGWTHLRKRYGLMATTKPLLDWVDAPQRAPGGVPVDFLEDSWQELARLQDRLEEVWNSPTWRTLGRVHQFLKRLR